MLVAACVFASVRCSTSLGGAAVSEDAAAPSSGSSSGSGASSGGTQAPDGGSDVGETSLADGGGAPEDATARPDTGTSSVGGGGGTPPTCAKPTPSPNDTRASECDYLLQSLDFEDQFGFPSPASAINVTSFGAAFGQYAVNACSPYCYAKNLTVGIDIVGGGSQAQVQGEIVLELPATGAGLPIAAADATRNILAWITFDGPAAPPFEIDTQLVLETASGIVPAVDSKAFFAKGGKLNPFGPFNVTDNYSYSNGCEFKYFPATSATGFPAAPANVTGIGFRIVAKAAAGQEWHGVAYVDHLQIRGPGADDPTDAGAYPYGL